MGASRGGKPQESPKNPKQPLAPSQAPPKGQTVPPQANSSPSPSSPVQQSSGNSSYGDQMRQRAQEVEAEQRREMALKFERGNAVMSKVQQRASSVGLKPA